MMEERRKNIYIEKSSINPLLISRTTTFRIQITLIINCNNFSYFASTLF